MAEQDEITLGEIYRMCQATNAQLTALTAEVRDRHHMLAEKMNAAVGTVQVQMMQYIGPVAVLEKQASDAEQNLQRLDGEVREMGKQAAKVSVLGTVAAMVMAVIPWPWKAGQ